MALCEGKESSMKSILFCFFLVCPAFAFSQKSENGLYLLASWMAGQFDNELQAKETKGYFDLHVSTVQIWKGRRDGYWLYTEEAGVDHLNMPHRQRAYRYYSADSAIVREEFEIPNARQYAGTHKFKMPLGDVSPETLLKREGCEVYFHYDSGKFIGRTLGKACPSEIGGVSYAVSEMEITSERMKSWDRGFNNHEEVVWGAAAPYDFTRRKAFEISKVRLKQDREVTVAVVPVSEPLPVTIPVLMPIPEIIPKPDSVPFAPPPVKADLKVLASYMSGHFETKNQTPDEQTFQDIQLDVVPIWSKKKDGYWLYAEEACANQKEVAYQQQVFHLYMIGGLFVQDTYTINSPVRFDGPKKFRKTLQKLHKDSLKLVSGCEIYFRYDSARFLGQTNRLNCPTKMAGAASGYKVLQIGAKEMKFTDHGFDTSGEPIVTGMGPFVYYRKPNKK